MLSFYHWHRHKRGWYLGALLSKGPEGVDQQAGSGAVQDVDAGRPHPGLQVIYGHGDVLGVALVEHPHLPIHGGAWHTMTVVVE